MLFIYHLLIIQLVLLSTNLPVISHSIIDLGECFFIVDVEIIQFREDLGGRLVLASFLQIEELEASEVLLEACYCISSVHFPLKQQSLERLLNMENIVVKVPHMDTYLTLPLAVAEDCVERAPSLHDALVIEYRRSNRKASSYILSLPVIEIGTIVSLEYSLVSDLELGSHYDFGPKLHVVLL